jgi:signal transduction histidine kinase
MKSISIKLWGLMLALVFIALILIWCFQIVFLESFYFSIHEKKLLKEGRNLVEMINANEERTIIEEKLNELLLKYNARIDLYTSAGIIIYSSESSPKPMIVDKNAFLMEIMQSKKAVSAFKHDSRGSLLLVGLPVIRDNVMTAAVIMTVPVASLKETVDTLKEQFVIISLILISVSSILAYVFSKYFTRPILEISNAAKAMAEGNLSIKVPVNTKDELGMLSATINHLSTQLQKIEQLRKELISNVSHEFKTPLSLIKGYAETIRDVENLSEEKRNKQLSIIIEESDKLNYMINEIMDLSQIQSDYYKLDKTDFRIKETIKAVVNRLTYHTENKKLCIEMDYKDDIWVHADERRMEQVLYNLLNNAINFSKEEECIFIRVIDKDKLIEVGIVDQGAGIPPEEIPFIWDRFYKSKEASAKHRGSGLGLAIVKGILDAHKLNFGVESEIGKGSRFWFEITKSA